MNEFQQYYGQQLAPQQMGQTGGLAPMGFLGGMFGAPLGGLIGRGIGGLFGNAKLGNQIGQVAGGIGGSFLPLGADPVSAAYAQQAQQQQLQQLQLQQQLQQQQMMQQPGDLSAQGWFGNMFKQVARPLGGAIGGAFGNAGLGNTIGGIAGQLGGMLPFDADPVAQAYAQQAMQEAQLQQLQQQGLAPQGWFGNLVKRVAKPLGGAIGGAFGNAGMGNTIGGIAGQLGGMLPFGADPVSMAYAQQAQQDQLQQLQLQSLMGPTPGSGTGWLGNLWRNRLSSTYTGLPPGIAGPRIGSLPTGQNQNFLPFSIDPMAQAYAMQEAQMQQMQDPQGLMPQGGWFGNLIKNVAQPLGGAIGGAFGNAGLGNAIGGIAGQLGGMLPFGADPITAAYAQQAAQQAQLAQLVQQQAGNSALYGGQQTLH